MSSGRSAPAGFSRGAIFGLSAVGGAGLVAAGLAVLLLQGVPGRLDPHLLSVYAEARADPPQQGACMDWPAGDEFCPLGGRATDDAPAHVLVWGDSHANAILPGVDLWLRDQGLTGLAAVKGGCPPIPGLTRGDRLASHDCVGHNARVMAAIEAHPDLSLIILHARWAQAVEGTRAEGEPGGDFVLTLPGDNPAGAAANHDLVAAALPAMVARLQEGGRKVLIIESVPEIGWSVPDGYFYQERPGKALPTPPDMAAVALRQTRSRALLDGLPGVMRASLLPDLCTPVCGVMDRAGLFSRDDDHLSTRAAVELVPVLLDRNLSDEIVQALR